MIKCISIFSLHLFSFTPLFILFFFLHYIIFLLLSHSFPNRSVCMSPYMLAFTANTLEIRMSSNGSLIQTINIPDLHLISCKVHMHTQHAHTHARTHTHTHTHTHTTHTHTHTDTHTHVHTCCIAAVKRSRKP